MYFEKKIKPTQNCMVVAHYDDEIIFSGFDELYKDGVNYTVIVCTFKDTSWHEGFLRIMTKLKVESYAVFNNLTSSEKDFKFSNEFEEELTRVIKNGNYSKILTHNAEGEYGHPQHIEINRIVTSSFPYVVLPFKSLDKEVKMGRILNAENKLKIEYLKLYEKSLHTNKFILDLIVRKC